VAIPWRLLNPTHPLIDEKRYAPEAQREAWYQLHPYRSQKVSSTAIGAGWSCTCPTSTSTGAGRDQIRPSELATVVGVDARPGAFASSLAWYRARAAQRGQRRVQAVIEVPTVALWGP
jgi:hypothetical protein